MSIIDTANHNVVGYTSGVTKAFSGQRLITLTYKTVTDKASALCGIKRESKAVSVPMITTSEIEQNIMVLIPHVRNMLQEAQKCIVRELLDAGNNVASVSAESISIASCVEYLDSSDESGRLTKESVGVWFDAEIQSTLAAMIAAKMGISDTPSDAESNKVLALVASFKKDISALAGGKTSYSIPVATQLRKAVNMASEGDVIAARFDARLGKMIDAKDVDYADAL